MHFILVSSSMSIERDRDAGRGGEAEIAASDHRVAPSVAREQLGLSTLGARVDFRRIADLQELRLWSKVQPLYRLPSSGCVAQSLQSSGKDSAWGCRPGLKFRDEER